MYYEDEEDYPFFSEIRPRPKQQIVFSKPFLKPLSKPFPKPCPKPRPKPCCDNIVDCQIPFSLVAVQLLVPGLGTLQNLNTNGLSAVITDTTLKITGDVIATFLVNDVPTDITFPVNYTAYQIECCKNTRNPVLVIRDFTVNIIDGVIVLIINGIVVTFHAPHEESCE